MTQKELLYIEDAIGHECIVIGILNNMIECLTDEELVNFSKKELKKHTSYKEELISYLKEESHG